MRFLDQKKLEGLAFVPDMGVFEFLFQLPCLSLFQLSFGNQIRVVPFVVVV